jgi:hypothetical protein
MNILSRIALSCLLGSAVVGHAQTTASDRGLNGVLGRGFAEIQYQRFDLPRPASDIHDLSFGGRGPLLPNLDLGGSCSHRWAPGGNRYRATTLRASATGYTAIAGVKPFGTAGLGYQWLKVTGAKNNDLVWSAGAGIEVPLGRVALTPKVTYLDDFRPGPRSSQELRTEVEANWWATESAGIYATFGRSDVFRGGSNSWFWGAGLRLTL